MYGNDDYNSYNRSGHSPHGSGYGASSSSRNEDETTSKSGELLGGLITLPDNIAPIANFLTNTVKPYIIERGEGFVGGHLPGLLQKTGLSSTTAQAASNRASTALAYFIVFSDLLAGTYQNVNQFIAGRKHLAEELSPVAKAHGAGSGVAGLLHSGLAHNEVVDIAKSRLRKRWVQDTFTDMSALAAALPTLYMRWVNKRQERAEQAATAAQEDSFGKRYQRFSEELKRDMGAETFGELSSSDIRGMYDTHVREQGHSIRQHQEDSAKTKETLDRFVVPGGAVMAEFLRGYFIEKEKKTSTKVTSLEMIHALAEVVINEKDATGVDGVPFEGYIRKIFDTHQENMHQPRIGKRFDEKMDFACKEIADAITEGKLHPMALVNLVGERTIVKDKGKHIASREEVRHAVADQIKLMPAKFAVDAEEYIAEAAVGEQDLKLALKDLKDDDRAFFISLLPEEVAKKLGLSEEEIKSAHETAKQGFGKHLASAVLDLATLSDEQLKAGKLSDEQISLIRELAPKAKEGKEKEVLEAVSKKGEFKGALDTAIVDAMGAGLERHPGDLYEKADKKIFAEHEHPGGSYEQEDKPHESHEHAHDLAADREKSPQHHDGWGALDEEADKGDEKILPKKQVHHVQHQGMERKPTTQELGV